MLRELKRGPAARTAALIGALLILAAAAPDAEQSGPGRCTGDYEGAATWTLGAGGKRIWDASGCRLREEVRSGTGRCLDDHEGVAVWTLDAGGKRVWDTSQCRPVER